MLRPLRFMLVLSPLSILGQAQSQAQQSERQPVALTIGTYITTLLVPETLTALSMPPVTIVIDPSHLSGATTQAATVLATPVASAPVIVSAPSATLSTVIASAASANSTAPIVSFAPSVFAASTVSANSAASAVSVASVAPVVPAVSVASTPSVSTQPAETYVSQSARSAIPAAQATGPAIPAPVVPGVPGRVSPYPGYVSPYPGYVSPPPGVILPSTTNAQPAVSNAVLSNAATMGVAQSVSAAGFTATNGIPLPVKSSVSGAIVSATGLPAITTITVSSYPTLTIETSTATNSGIVVVPLPNGGSSTEQFSIAGTAAASSPGVAASILSSIASSRSESPFTTVTITASTATARQSSSTDVNGGNGAPRPSRTRLETVTTNLTVPPGAQNTAVSTLAPPANAAGRRGSSFTFGGMVVAAVGLLALR